jgi:hypothetical protein
MRNSKHGLKALVLTMMAALGVMAFSAVGAQAALPGDSSVGEFLINLAAVGALKASVTGSQLGNGYLLVATRDLKIECTGLDVVGGVINSSTDAFVEVLFLGCLANNHKGEMLEGCEFKVLKDITADALVLPILHNGENFLLFEPLDNKVFPEPDVFTVVSFKPGIGCVLPLNNPVTGSVVAKVDQLEAEKPEILFSEAIQLLSGDVLQYGTAAQTSYVNGTADLELTGTHKGLKLGIH